MNANDDQSLAILSSIIFLKSELERVGAEEDLAKQAFDIHQQLLQFSYNMNDQLRVAKEECVELTKAVRENALAANLQSDIADRPHIAVVYMKEAIVELRKAIRSVIKRTALFCAIAALLGGLVAFAITFLIDRF